MSFFGGLWNFGGQPVTANDLIQFGKGFDNLPSDSECIQACGEIGILYRAHHTTPDARLQEQPYFSCTGKMVAWSGRLDNRDELLPLLRDKITVLDTSDVQIVTAAFESWGIQTFSRIRGDWSVVIWDPVREELLLARDYIGIRHLFYSLTPSGIAWCTHLKPLAVRCGAARPCDVYMAGYLALWPSTHVTPYEEIRSVVPGTMLRVTAKGLSSTTYWTFNPSRTTRYPTDREYEVRFEYLLTRSIQSRLRAVGPVLAGLSGGFDSSSIVCVCDGVMRRTGCGATEVDTFSFFHHNEPEEDDFLYFTAIERHRGRKGVHVAIDSEEVRLTGEGEEFVPLPSIEPSSEVTRALESLTERGYRVMLSGLGGDEMLGQALDPRIQIADTMFNLRVTALKRELAEWGLLLKYPVIQLLLQAGSLLFKPAVHFSIHKFGLPNWLNKTLVENVLRDDPQFVCAKHSLMWPPSMRDWFSTFIGLSRQVSHSVPGTQEVRYPFLDQDLVEFLFAIPTTQLLRPGERRSLMRRSLKHLLPPEVLARRVKARGGRSLITTVRKNWPQYNSMMRSLLVADLHYVDAQQFRAALERMRAGELIPESLQVLKTLSLEFWLRRAIGHQRISIETKTCVQNPAVRRPVRNGESSVELQKKGVDHADVH